MNATTVIFSTHLVPLFDVQTARVLATLLAENKCLRAENQILRQEKEALTARLALEVAKRFGPSSERRPAASVEGSVPATPGFVPAETSQPALGSSLAETLDETALVPERKSRGAQTGHPGHGRSIPAELPREEHEHTLPESERTCPTCGLPYKESGLTETSEEVDVQVKVIVLRHIRKCYRPVCACPEARPLLVAPVPPKLIPKGKFSLQTWVKFLLDKYLAQLPVNRQRLLLAQAGLPISKGTLHGGFDRLQDYLIPLYEHFLAHLRQMEHLHADETRWMIFEDVAGKANHRWWLWLFASTDVVCLVLDPHRSAAVPFKTLSEPLPKDMKPPSDPMAVTREIEGQTYVLTSHLKSISADRYPVYPSLSPYIHIAFCWAHQRRDFTDFQAAHAHESDQVAWAAAWIATIGHLYKLNEDRLTELGDLQTDTTAQAALEQAIALIAQKVAARTELSTPQRKLMESMHAHWAGLTFFVGHPAIPMDNNQAERYIRLPVVGRKNYLGHQTRRAGQMGAILYSIVLTCQLHGISPFDFLVRYFQACAEGHAPPADLTPFSPWIKPTAPETKPPPTE
jgi:transposase